MDNIHELCFLTQGEENNNRKEELYRLTFDEDNRVAFNALHVLSNFDLANNEWLYCKQDELIDRRACWETPSNAQSSLTPAV